ncbi:hypothetical protein NT04LS_1422 [Listeria seeligeri FSL S4-171]|uniref:Uncharacterized protein n=1 Tax=Listeria seeligeri FSL N1-067 TaxID=702453 RepID=E3ZPY9_LISSE|nr:hypothetical protein NT03LS_1537 [Listeria seeligeri FSL N1-067]EFS03427.1 hypothetical protein NT04LS_1422 [Listeria seeligeri FSL S4-171]
MVRLENKRGWYKRLYKLKKAEIVFIPFSEMVLYMISAFLFNS